MLNFINAFKLLKKKRLIYAFFSLAVFMFFIPDFIEALIISKTLTQPGIWVFMIVRSISLMLAATLFFIGILNTGKVVSSEERPSPNFNTKTAIPAIVYFLTGLLLFTLFVRFCYPTLSGINVLSLGELNILRLMSIAALLVLIFTSLILLLGSILSFDRGITFFNVFDGLVLAVKYFFKKPFSLLFSFIFSLIIFVAIHFIRPLLYYYIEAFNFSAIAEIFFEGALISCIIGLVLSAFIGAYYSSVSASPRESFLTEGVNPAKISILCIAVVFVAIPLLNMPVRLSLSTELIKAVDGEFATAKEYVDTEELDLAAYHFRRSYNLSDALRSYFKYLMNEKDSTFTDAEKAKQRSEIEAVFKKVEQNNSGIGIFYYINSLRYKQLKAPDQQLKSLEYSLKLSPNFPNTNYELLDLYKSKNNSELLKTTRENLLNSRNYIKFNSLDSLSQKDLKKLIDQLDEKAKASYEKFPILAYYYYENKMYEEALLELQAISKVMPDDLAVNYLIAMVDLELMKDNKRYDDALKAVDNILKNNSNESWALELKTQVAIKAGNKDIVEKNLEQLYQKDSSNLDIAEQYAYSLMSKNTSFTINDFDKKAETILQKILQQSKDRWFAYYCQSILDLKKNEYEKSLNNFISFTTIIRNQSELFQIYDDFYYLYALKFKGFITKPEAQKAMNALRTKDPLAYNYLNGTYYWSVKDYTKGKSFMSEAVSIAPELSKAHFLLGNVYFENAFLKKVNDDYPLAIGEYKKALSIFEEDPYAWFSLGHVFKKLEKYEEALGAFQKSIYYMPQEDHNFDHFGISIHSRMQVDEIKKKLATN